MTKRTWHHIWRRLRLISSWYFVVGLVVASVIAVWALRRNNVTAIYLRDQVSQADEQNADVEQALKQLRTYVYAHMNTNLASGPNAIKPPVQLKYRYERLVAAEKARISASNARIYTEAQSVCEKQFPNELSGRNRVPCIQDYVAKNGAQEQPIPEALYKFDFASPVWSPDLAGWSLVLAGIFGLLLVVRVSLELWLSKYLNE